MDSNGKTEAYRRLFLTEAGGLKPDARVVLEDLLEVTFFFKPPPLAGSLPPQFALALVEGGRNALRHILKKCGAGSQMLQRLLTGDENERDLNEQPGE